MQRCTTEDLIEVILPRLIPTLSVWQYLSARAEATSSLSSSSTNSPAAVAADVAARNVDVAAMLDQYAALHRSVRSFCEDLLEEETEPAKSCGKVEAPSPEKDSAVNSALQNDRKRHPQNDTVACIETSSIPNTGGTEDACGRITDTIDRSEMLQNTGSSVDGQCSGFASSLCMNGDLSDSAEPARSADYDSVCATSESCEQNSGKLVTDGNTKTGNFSASNGNIELGNFRESDGSVRTVSKLNSEMSKTNGIVTCVVESADDSELLKLDCCKVSCGTSAVNSAGGEAVKAEKSCALQPADDLSTEAGLASVAADSSQAVNELRTPCSVDTSETPHTVVTAVNNVLEVSILYCVVEMCGIDFCYFCSVF